MIEKITGSLINPNHVDGCNSAMTVTAPPAPPGDCSAYCTSRNGVFYGGSCYYVLHTGAGTAWSSAMTECRNDAVNAGFYNTGRLAIIDTAAKWTAIKQSNLTWSYDGQFRIDINIIT